MRDPGTCRAASLGFSPTAEILVPTPVVRFTAIKAAPEFAA